VNAETCWPPSFWEQKVATAELVPMESRTPTRKERRPAGIPALLVSTRRQGGETPSTRRRRTSSGYPRTVNELVISALELLPA